MIDAPCTGCAQQAAPNRVVLPPAVNGYGRCLYPGRGVSVYFDRDGPNEWGEHAHFQDHLFCLLDPVESIIRLRDSDGSWREFTAHGPAVWVIPGQTRHAGIRNESADRVLLYCEPTFVRDTLGANKTEFTIIPLSQLVGRDSLVGPLIKAFKRLCREEDTVAPGLYVESIGTTLAAHILLALFKGGAARPRSDGLSDSNIVSINSYIDEHLADELSLPTLARVCTMSPSHFSRLFKRTFNLAPHNYVMRRRVEKAEELLRASDEKEITIALQCGFSDDTLMARWFRRVAECLPSEVRARRGRETEQRSEGTGG